MADQDMNDSPSPSDSVTIDDPGTVTSQSAPSLHNHDSFSERPRTSDDGTTKSSPRANGNQTSPLHHSSLNPRSCVTCRKRKVKCDKSHPCSNCRRAGIECIFPKPGRAPRRNKKAPDSELLARLRQLEVVVQKMGKSGEGEGLESPEQPPDGGLPRSTTELENTTQQYRKTSLPAPLPADPGRSGPELGMSNKATGNPVMTQDVTKLKNEMGRLVVEHGKSRYVSNKFWAQLTEELAELQELLEVGSSGDEDDGSSPGSSKDSNKEKHMHQEFIFGYSSLMTTLRILHPHPRQIMTYWSLYKENIDPVLRLLHKPTIESMFITASGDLDHLSKSTEALMFSIYLTVVTSLSPGDCRKQLDMDKDTALGRYRYATEQALAKAGFVETQELRVLQASMLFLAAVRRFDGSSFSWAMTGLLMRISQRQGLHRDGANFGLCPFDTEERRRLWWQMSTFDGRASDDQGIDPMFFQMTFDTRIPLNIHDEDIWPGMKEPPVERERPTDMIFDLTRYEIGSTIRQLKLGMRSGASVEYRDQLIDGLRERLESKYLRYCDMSVPLEWVTVNICRLVLAKIWLMAHYPLKFNSGHIDTSEELRHRTFVKSVDIIRYTRLLETQHKTLKWGWMFRTYSQWHAAAFAFDELRRRTSGPEVDEAWRVMDEAFREWESPTSGYTKSILWKPITRLRAMAKEARRKEVMHLQMFPTDGSIGPSAGPTRSVDAPLDLSAPPEWQNSVTADSSVATPNTMIDSLPLGMEQGGAVKMEQQQGMSTPVGMAPTPGAGTGMVDGNFAVPTDAELSQWLMQDANMQDTSWLTGETDMNWSAGMLNAMVTAEPIDVDMGAMWGDVSASGRI